MKAVEHAARAALRAAGYGSRLVETDVAHHHVLDGRGRGPRGTIVFLPGLSDTAASLVPVLMRVRRHVRRVIVVESAGHGLSSPARTSYTLEAHVESIGDVLDAVLDEPAVLVGNSLGGATALLYTAAQPARVRGLYLTSPGGAALDDANLADLRRAFTIRSARDGHAFLDRVLARPSAAAPLLARVVQARASSPEVVTLLTTLGPEHALPPEALAAITVPITLLWGGADRLLPPEALAYFCEHLPAHAQVVLPADLGHCPHLDDPGRLARLVAAFAARVTA